MLNYRFPRLAALAAILTLGIFALPCPAQTADTAAAASSRSSQPQEADQETKELHDKLAKYLTGTKWTGKFTLDGKPGTNEEYYEILSAEKGETGDTWNLIARIKYGGKDMTLPLPPLDIKFAGRTPVITIDRLFVPGFGTFDARVVIRQGKYAGTWAHRGEGMNVGGHLFGSIEKMTAEELQQAQGKGETKSDQDQ